MELVGKRKENTTGNQLLCSWESWRRQETDAKLDILLLSRTWCHAINSNFLLMGERYRKKWYLFHLLCISLFPVFFEHQEELCDAYQKIFFLKLSKKEEYCDGGISSISF